MNKKSITPNFPEGMPIKIMSMERLVPIMPAWFSDLVIARQHMDLAVARANLDKNTTPDDLGFLKKIRTELDPFETRLSMKGE